MSTVTKNPVVEAIISGKAPRPARLAAASGMLPLAQAELLEILVALRESDESEIASAATQTLSEQVSDGSSERCQRHGDLGGCAQLSRWHHCHARDS